MSYRICNPISHNQRFIAPWMVGYDSNSGWGVGTVVDGYTVLSSVSAKVEKGLSAAADYVDEQISSFSWSEFQYSIPVWGSVRRASYEFDQGNYGAGFANFGLGVAEALTLGFGAEVSTASRGVTGISTELIAAKPVVKSSVSVVEEGATKTGLTNAELVSQAAIRAERAIGGTGRFAGTAKHTYATTLLKRYQRIYGNRGLEVNEYFTGRFGRGYLDVHDVTNGIIYDFKFGQPYMKASQFSKYSNTFGQPVYIVDKFGNLILR